MPYSKADCLNDMRRLAIDLYRSDMPGVKRTAADALSKFNEQLTLRIKNYIVEKYKSGNFRYNPSSYSDPRYKPDLDQIPFQPRRRYIFSSEPQTFNYQWLFPLSIALTQDAVAKVKSHPVGSFAFTAAVYCFPKSTLVGSLAYTAWKILDS